MANIFERYGIKEVAEVYFEALTDDKHNGYKAGDVVLFLDTLKVSTIETTAENVSAQGGVGNPKLITWDYGKDINVTLEDAVISWEELRILMGAKAREASEQVTVKKNEQVSFAKGDAFAAPEAAGEEYKWIDITNGLRGTHEDFADKHSGNAAEKTIVRFFWEEQVAAADASELIITPDDFPGTYRVIGDTLVRSEKDGKDSKFQFVINKAKLLSEVTITMQAEGEPSTFSMTLNVLRDEDGNMMSLIKY